MANATQDRTIPGLEPFYNARMESNEDTIFATIDYFHQAHHAMFVKVKQDKDNIWVGTNDPHGRLEDIYSLYDYALIPVELPGLAGHWMVCVHPYGD